MFQKNADVVNFLRQIMLVSGVALLTVLVLMFVKPEPTNPFQANSPFDQEEIVIKKSDAIVLADTAPATNKQQKTIANWLAKRYRVADDAAHTFVSAAYLTAKELKLDPLLILSVMAIESGLNPFAESAVGAQGLMQVMSKIHHDKFEEFGGIQAALDPIANIQVGAQILKEYVTRGGSVKAGLKMYVGAALAETDGGYGNKVLGEYHYLKDVANGKSVPVFIKASAPVAVAKPAVVNATANDSEIITTEMNEQVGDNQMDAST